MTQGLTSKFGSLIAALLFLGTAPGVAQEPGEAESEPIEDVNAVPPADPGNKDREGWLLVGWAGDQKITSSVQVPFLWRLAPSLSREDPKNPKSRATYSYGNEPVTSRGKRLFDPRGFTPSATLDPGNTPASYFTARLDGNTEPYLWKFAWKQILGEPATVNDAGGQAILVRSELVLKTKNANSTLFFLGKKSTGYGLWKLDVTDPSANTKAVSLYDGLYAGADDLTAVGDVMYFTVANDVYVWVAGTAPRRIFNPTGNVDTHDLVAGTENLFFVSGGVVWWVDAAGVKRAHGSGPVRYSNPMQLTYLKTRTALQRLFFVGEGFTKNVLFEFDPDNSGLGVVATVGAGRMPTSLTIFEKKNRRRLFFIAEGSGGGRTVWMSNGLKAREVVSLGRADDMQFLANTDSKLYATSGPDSASGLNRVFALSRRGWVGIGDFKLGGAEEFLAVESRRKRGSNWEEVSRLFFLDHRGGRNDLWVDQGAYGALAVASSRGSAPDQYVQFSSSKMMFAAAGTDANGESLGRELWYTDGLEGATAIDIVTGEPSSNPEHLTVVKDATWTTLYLVAETKTTQLGRALHWSDGKVATPVRWPGLTPLRSARRLTRMEGKVFFSATEKTWYAFRSSATGVTPIELQYRPPAGNPKELRDPRDFAVIPHLGKDYLFFTAVYDNKGSSNKGRMKHRVILATDATFRANGEMKVILIGATCSVAAGNANFTPFGDLVIFNGTRGIRGEEPFRLDSRAVKAALDAMN
jgi:ELWxxDGT repeat protein